MTTHHPLPPLTPPSLPLSQQQQQKQALPIPQPQTQQALSQRPKLLEEFLAEKSESERAKIWQIVAKTKIDEDDPIFLIMVAMATVENAVVKIPEQLERRESKLQELNLTLTDRIEDFESVANDIVSSAACLDKRLKTRTPGLFSKRGDWLTQKRLASAVCIAFLAGTLFGQLAIKAISSIACESASICISVGGKE